MNKPLDLAGLGIGPFNLSIAALLREVPQLHTAFFDRKPQFNWHPGMMLPGVRLQTSYLKDLVTGVAPWSPNSFLNYLVQKGRFYAFMNADLPAVSRAEFADYMAWVADGLGNLHFGRNIQYVDFDGDLFHIHFREETEPVRARNLCLGTGKTPFIPQSCRPWRGDDCFHNMELTLRQPDVAGQRVTVVGGGQSGAEVVLSLLQGDWGRPESIHWLSRRPNFEPLDETPFTNEYFTPGYVDTFHQLPEAQRLTLVENQKLASDGISPDTLEALYQRLYEHRISGGESPRVVLQPHRSLQALAGPAPFQLDIHNALNGERTSSTADRVILCTGFESRLPDYLSAALRQRLETDDHGHLRLASDFQAQWDGPPGRHLYAVNAGRHSHGIADPQMSLMCWRSARIINHLAGETLFPVTGNVGLVDWNGDDPRVATGDDRQSLLALLKSDF
ncbi:lysine 6-monooxygenase [Halovibrio salipaludis]|uniref:Lysine 6-monooxygenase n=1 Tax=Halovibrio salipaludis TaxID=2032626 RepID=A0A2A2FAS5_9GAMM|nr:SidA/IucD/PvdA family monooxygenase [Halovibrio salipaludis]PAU81729.1 lysine 6-monooxygenase [Halovibrio salipaludis]